MGRFAQRLFPAAGLLVAVFATAVMVRVWLADSSFSAGTSAQRRGEFTAAAVAYRAASGHGNADAAIELARLELLRRDWAGAGESLREAMALVPTRSFPKILQARLEIDRPGEWDGAREERVLAAGRAAVALEPGRGEVWCASAATLLKLAALRRGVWDPARTREVISEAADRFAGALTRDPGSAQGYFVRMIAEGGDPVFLLTVASRHGAAASLSTLVGLLLDRALWTAAEDELWAAAEALGILPAYAAAASEALARRSLVREGLAAARRGLLAAPGDADLTKRAADIAARLRQGNAER